jgi:lipopolysaccharide export system permease protein
MSPIALRRIDRYVLRQLVVALVAVTTALVALIWLTQSLRFVELVVNRGLSVVVFIRLTGLLIPNFVALILPITTYVVVQFVYNRLSGDRELTVMRAAGVSPSALARPALMLAGATMLAGFMLNIWVVPASFAAFRQFQLEIRNRVAAFLLEEGVFTPISDDLTVYVRTRDQDGTLRGIMVDDARDKDARATIFAARGQLIADEQQPRVVLMDGSREELDSRTGRLNVLTFAQNTIDLTEAKAAATREIDPSEMSMRELLHPTAAEAAGHDTTKMLVEANRRLTQPLTGLSFTLIALVTVLSGSFRRHGGLVRPAAGLLSVVGSLVISLALTNLGVRQPELMPVMWVNALAPGAVCAWLLVRPELRRLPPAFALRRRAA